MHERKHSSIVSHISVENNESLTFFLQNFIDPKFTKIIPRDHKRQLIMGIGNYCFFFLLRILKVMAAPSITIFVSS